MLPATAWRDCCCALQVDVRDKWQFTPLHSAANGGHVSTIRKLIQFSHDVDVKDYLGEHHACLTLHPQSHLSITLSMLACWEWHQ